MIRLAFRNALTVARCPLISTMPMVYTMYPVGKLILIGSFLAAILAACAAAEIENPPTGAAGSAAAAGRSDAGSPRLPSGGAAGNSSAAGGAATGGAAANGGTASASPIGDGSTDVGHALDSGNADAPLVPDPCSLSLCNGHGLCSATAQGPFCTCDEGFDAPHCSVRNADYGRRVKIAENLADPDVIKFSDDRYLLSGTGTGVDFKFLESRDLITWSQVASYNPSVADPSYDYCFCWAPDIASVNGNLYLYFSAHRGPNGSTTCPPPNGFDVTTYRAASLDGSLNFGVPELLFQGQTGAQSRTQAGCPAAGCGQAIRIDPTVYDGRLYYVFFDRGNDIASVSMNNPSDFRLHAGPAGWSMSGFEEGINEAPELLARGGRFYLFFSAAWYNSQYATFYVMGSSTAELTRDRPLHRLTTPVRRGNGNLIESHGHNSIATRRGETFNFFHQGVFDAAGGLIRRDTYRQRIAWNDDGTAISQNQTQVSWNSLGGGNQYSLDLVLRNGSVIGPCIAAGRIGQSTSTTFAGVCADAGDRLFHKSEVRAFRLYASPGTTFSQVGEAPYDGYSDAVNIAAARAEGWGRDGDAIDPHFYTRYLASLREPEPIESALNAPRALESWWMADLSALRTAGLIRSDHRVALTSAGADLATALEPIVTEMLESESPLRRAWLAIVIGDFLRAQAALNLTIPMAREDAAAGLVLLGTNEAIDILRRSRAQEAQLAGKCVPEQKRKPFIPVAKWIKWRGEYRPTYRFDDIIEANLPEMLAERLQFLRKTYGAHLARFRANVRT